MSGCSIRPILRYITYVHHEYVGFISVAKLGRYKNP